MIDEMIASNDEETINDTQMDSGLTAKKVRALTIIL